MTLKHRTLSYIPKHSVQLGATSILVCDGARALSGGLDFAGLIVSQTTLRYVDSRFEELDIKLGRSPKEH